MKSVLAARSTQSKMATAGDNHGEVIQSDQADQQIAPNTLSKDTDAKPSSRAPSQKEYKGLRRIIRNFTPSYVLRNCPASFLLLCG